MLQLSDTVKSNTQIQILTLILCIKQNNLTKVPKDILKMIYEYIFVPVQYEKYREGIYIRPNISLNELEAINKLKINPTAKYLKAIEKIPSVHRLMVKDEIIIPASTLTCVSIKITNGQKGTYVRYVFSFTDHLLYKWLKFMKHRLSKSLTVKKDNLTNHHCKYNNVLSKINKSANTYTLTWFTFLNNDCYTMKTSALYSSSSYTNVDRIDYLKIIYQHLFGISLSNIVINYHFEINKTVDYPMVATIKGIKLDKNKSSLLFKLKKITQNNF